MTTPSSPSVLIGDPGFVLIVFEMGFQPPREAAFAGGHPAYCARKDGDEVRHAKLSDTLSDIFLLWGEINSE